MGLGGAGFPAREAQCAGGKSIDTLIVNVAECEPHITSDHREALENGENVLHGVYKIKEILGVHRVLIAIEDNKPDAIEALRKIADNAALDPNDEVRVLPLRAMYPQGAEKVLVQACTGRRVPADDGHRRAGSRTAGSEKHQRGSRHVGGGRRFAGAFGLHPLLSAVVTGIILALNMRAFFMATDYSTSPVTAPGRIIYGVGCGALTVLIRVFGGFPEGVSFAILIMNCCAWMFDKHTQRRQFGVSREDVKAKKAAAKAAKKEAKEAAANG